MTNSYREGTTLKEIVEDGWSRGLHSSQTLQEAQDMGYPLNIHVLFVWWAELDKEFEKDLGDASV